MAYSFKSVTKFMVKNNFSELEIRYILREQERTQVYLMDGRSFDTAIPLAYFEGALSNKDFTRINKSVLIANAQVVKVNQCTYLMTDGKRLEGRHHQVKAHSSFMQKMVQQNLDADDLRKTNLIMDKFQAFDKFPVPFCVIQLVFDLNGKSTSFIFRYCNQMMSKLEKLPLDMILNHSFYDIFENPDEKWLALYGDVAKNGGIKIFKSYKQKLGKFMNIVCYQTAPGYCGCLIMQEDWQDLLSTSVFT